MSNATLISLAEELRVIADELDEAVTDGTYAKGTIVKAKPEQSRFKTSSLWVSLGNGKFKHLNGKKGLIAKAERLDGFVDVVFQA